MAGGIFKNFFRPSSWALPEIPSPWGARPSLYEHVKQHLKTDGSGLADGGANLPDEATESEEGGLLWAAGAMDGVFGHHVEDDAQEKVAEAVVSALSRAEQSANQANIDGLYSVLKANRTLGFIDPFLERIRRKRGLSSDRVHALATWLATRAADREPVKSAIALLGVFPQAGDEAVLLTLGRHEEFTVTLPLRFPILHPTPSLCSGSWRRRPRVGDESTLLNVSRRLRTRRSRPGFFARATRTP